MGFDLNYFEDFPKTEDETVKEWMKNASPYINYVANIGVRVCDEIKQREKLQHDMIDDVADWSQKWEETLDLLKELRGRKWGQPIKGQFACSECEEITKITAYIPEDAGLYHSLLAIQKCEKCARKEARALKLGE